MLNIVLSPWNPGVPMYVYINLQFAVQTENITMVGYPLQNLYLYNYACGCESHFKCVTSIAPTQYGTKFIFLNRTIARFMSGGMTEKLTASMYVPTIAVATF